MQRFSFGLTPRRSLSRLDNHSVRFTGLTTPSTTNTSESLGNSNSLRQEISKSTSFGDSFQSVESILLPEPLDSKLNEIEKQLKEIDEDIDETEKSETKETTPIKCPGTPKRRRSLRSEYFNSLLCYEEIMLMYVSGTPTPVRQSPRLTKRPPLDGKISSPSTPQDSSTPNSSPRRLLPAKRMSLQQKVLTYNALKALTPKSSTVVEKSYSKVDTVTTKITTAERVEESVVTSVMEKSDVVKEDIVAKSHEHRETSKITSENSISDYSENDIVLDNYISSPYKGINLSDSILQSDAEETKSAAEEVEEQQNIEQNQEVENETETDPTFNIYETPEELAEGENSQETHTVLTEVPIMSEEQYSAMEENTFDELHEEYFNEEMIVQEYLSPSSKTTVTPDEPKRTEPMVSDIIEIDSSTDSSASEKENAVESESNSSASSSEEEKTSDSESASENSDDKNIVCVEEVAKEDDEAIESDVSADSIQEESSDTSDSDHPRESIFDEDTEELPTKDSNENQNNEISKQTLSEECAHLPEIVIEEEIIEPITEETTSDVVEVIEDTETKNQKELETMENVEVIEYTITELQFEENIQQGVESKQQEVEEAMDDVEVIEYTSTVLQSKENLQQGVESKKQEVEDEVMVNVEVNELQPEANQEVLQQQKLLDRNKSTEQEVLKQSKLSPIAEVEGKTENNSKENEERERSIKKQKTTNADNQQKSDLDFSVISESHMSRSLGLTLHKTDLSFSFKSSKSDLDYSLSSDEGSFKGFTTTSTPHIEKKASDEGFETQVSTPRTRRSKSVDLLVPVERSEGRLLRKRSTSVESTEKQKSRKRNVPVQLPAIFEDEKEANNAKKAKRKRQTKRAQSTTGVLEQRRVTRRQRSLLEKAATAHEDSSNSEGDERGPTLDPIDPIQLLHKPSFKGMQTKGSKQKINQSF